jgi:hypothetical protein
MAHTASASVSFTQATRLLRCRKTHRYFSGRGWTQDLNQAQTFVDNLEAARACVTHDLHDLELVLCTQASGVELFSTPVR